MLTSRRGRRLAVRLLALFACILPLLVSPAGMALATAPLPHSSTHSAPAQTATVAFVPNRGQHAAEARFQADIAGGMATVFDDGVQLTLATSRPGGSSDPHARSLPAGPVSLLRMQFLGAATRPTLTPQDVLPGVFNDYTGDDETRWRTNLPTYAGLRMTGLYPQIAVDYAGDAGNLKSTYTVAPGGDPGRIRWRYSGAQDVRLAPTDELVLTLPPVGGQPGRTVTETAPIAWQEVGAGRVDVGVRFRLDTAGTIGFALDGYDPALPLVIDPTLTTTALSNMTGAYGIARDTAGNLYVSGCSTAGARLSKLTPSGVAISTTAFGYNSTSCGVDVAVAPNGRILVAGADQAYAETSSRAFVASWASATATPIVTQLATGDQLATVEAKSVAFSPNQQGYVLWGDSASAPDQSFIAAITNGVPGSSVALGSDPISGLAVDGTETLYTTRTTPSGNVLVKATLAGVSSLVPITPSNWVGLDAANNVYVAGSTFDINATSRLYVQSLSSQGQTRYAWSSAVLAGYSQVYDAAVDPDGGLVLVGMTNADAFPRVGGVGIPRTNDMYSAFILQLTPSGTGTAYSDLYNATTTWNRGTQFASITIDAAGNAAVAGSIINLSNEWVSGLLINTQLVSIIPNYTVSYYESTNYAQDFRSQGCRARENGEQGIAFLFFGLPTSTGASGYGSNPSYEDIKVNVRAFIDGYYYHSSCYDNNITVSAPKGANLTIAVSTSNSYKCNITPPPGQECPQAEQSPNPNLNVTTGGIWALMVADIAADVSIRNIKGIDIAAGLDAEPDWDEVHPEMTDAWIQGYGQAEPSSGIVRPLYVFGSTDGATRTGAPTRDWTAGELAHLDKIYKWNFKSPFTRSVPQIYNASYAQEWYQIRQYTILVQKKPQRVFNGIMTQCGSSGCDYPYDNPYWTTYATCVGNPKYQNLEPAAGWRAMSDRLNKTLKTTYSTANDFQMPSGYRVSEKLTITIPGEGVIPECTYIPSRLFPAGTTFDAGNIFIYKINPSPVFTVETSQELRWVTDISSNLVAPKR